MKLTFKQVAHLYVGAPCLIGDRNWKPSNIPDSQRAPYTDPDYGKPIISTIDFHALGQYMDKMTPILKRLKDISEIDLTEFLLQFHTIHHKPIDISSVKVWFRTNNHWRPEYFHYLLSKGYDLFGLIDANEAIDEKTWKKSKT